MTVEQFIEKRVEEKELRPHFAKVYSDGLGEGIELMGEFAGWVNAKFYRYYNDKWQLKIGYDVYTTPELIELFLTEKMKEI